MAKKKKIKKKTSGNPKKKGGGLQSKLKSLRASWEGAEPRRSGFPVPDGNYVSRITGAILEEAASTKRLQINWTLVCLEGDYKGKVYHKYAGLETEQNLAFVQGDLETLELEIPEDINDIGDVLEQAADLVIDNTVRTSDEFSNVFFNELIEGYEEEEEEEEPEEEPEEEEPDEGEELTEAQVKKMKKKELGKVIKDYELDVDPDDYDTTKKLQAAVIDELFE